MRGSNLEFTEIYNNAKFDANSTANPYYKNISLPVEKGKIYLFTGNGGTGANGLVAGYGIIDGTPAIIGYYQLANDSGSARCTVYIFKAISSTITFQGSIASSAGTKWFRISLIKIDIK